jgi:hypothetical protein
VFHNEKKKLFAQSNAADGDAPVAATGAVPNAVNMDRGMAREKGALRDRKFYKSDGDNGDSASDKNTQQRRRNNKDKNDKNRQEKKNNRKTPVETEDVALLADPDEQTYA